MTAQPFAKDLGLAQAVFVAGLIFKVGEILRCADCGIMRGGEMDDALVFVGGVNFVMPSGQQKHRARRESVEQIRIVQSVADAAGHECFRTTAVTAFQHE